MKHPFRTLLALVLLVTHATAGQTVSYPVGQPIFSITFPDDWKVEAGESVSASSADELANLELIVLDADEAATAIEDAKAALGEELKGVKWNNDNEKGLVDGMEVSFLDGSFTIEGVKMSVNCAVFAPKQKKAYFMLFCIIPAEAEEKHGEALLKIFQSIKG